MAEDNLEAELQNKAEQQGLLLRQRSDAEPPEPDGQLYELVDPGSDTVVAGDDDGLTLKEVEDWFQTDHETPQAHVEKSPNETRRPSRPD